MAQIARMLRRAFQAPSMIDLVIKSFPTPLRAVGVHPLPVLMLPRQGRLQRLVRCPRAACLPVDRPLLRAAVAFLAGVLALAQPPHLKTRAGRVQMSLLAATRVTMRTAKRIVVNASLLPTTLPMAGVAAVALVALAVAPVVLVAPVVPAVEAAMCLGTNMISIGR